MPDIEPLITSTTSSTDEEDNTDNEIESLNERLQEAKEEYNRLKEITSQLIEDIRAVIQKLHDSAANNPDDDVQQQ